MINTDVLRDPEARRRLELRIARLPNEAARNACRQLLLETLQYGQPISAQYLKPPVPLRGFVSDAWHVIEPNPFVGSWHIDAICEHLEAVTLGKIKNLLINISPRCSKSIIVSQLWPCWVWTFRPSFKWLFASYSGGLSTEHAWRSRQLLLSDWYRARWGHVFSLLDDQNRKTRYDNDRMGYRMSTSVAAQATGFGGDGIVIDDPNNITTVESDAARYEVNHWWDEVMSTRLNNAITGCRVVIQQRCHQEDLTGHILEKEKEEWVHLRIPMRYEPEYQCVVFMGGDGKIRSLPEEKPTSGQPAKPRVVPEGATKFWEDPRTQKGELMVPERFPEDEVKKLEVKLGSYGAAGQFQQAPAPPGGGIFKRVWFGVLEEMPRKVLRTVRFWDAAGTTAEEDPGACWTTGVKMSKTADGHYIIEHVVREQLSSEGVDKLMKATAVMDGRNVRIREEKEPGSSGKSVINAHTKLLSGYDYAGVPPDANKVTRARPFAAQAEAGNVFLLKGAWNEAYLDEVANFPTGKLKDQADGSSGAFNEIEFGEWGEMGGIF